MRRALNLIPVVVAIVAVMGCSKTEKPPAADTAMSDAAMAPAAAPAMTEADVAGTWTGTSMPVGSDSVIAKWTQVCAGGSCKGTSEGSTVTTRSAYTLAGDSSVGVTDPYTDPSIKAGKLIDTWVARVNGDNVTGTGAIKLASNPDSVMMRYSFTGSRVR